MVIDNLLIPMLLVGLESLLIHAHSIQRYNTLT